MDEERRLLQVIETVNDCLSVKDEPSVTRINKRVPTSCKERWAGQVLKKRKAFQPVGLMMKKIRYAQQVEGLSFPHLSFLSTSDESNRQAASEERKRLTTHQKEREVDKNSRKGKCDLLMKRVISTAPSLSLSYGCRK